jgi:glycosyltransferase involved in cell wall biosynthesis
LKQMGVKINWTVIGDGPEKQMLLEKTAGRENFSFHTPADFSGVADLLAKQDVYILPSRLDGLPVALIEAMSVGCVPVISEFNKGMKKIVTPDMGFVLPVGDDKAFAQTIAKLDKDRSLLEQLSATARQKTRDNYDINLQAKKYFDLFGKYKELKRKLPRKLPLYRGLLVHYFVPRAWRKSLKKLLKK